MLQKQIDRDIIEAMKTNKETELSTLRLLKSAIHNFEISSQKKLEDSDIRNLVRKEIKSRQESIELYKKGGRTESAEKEEKEIEVLKKYQGEQLSQKEIAKLIDKTITETNAQGPQDIGKVMGRLMTELKGKADGSVVSRMVREKLPSK